MSPAISHSQPVQCCCKVAPCMCSFSGDEPLHVRSPALGACNPPRNTKGPGGLWPCFWSPGLIALPHDSALLPRAMLVSLKYCDLGPEMELSTVATAWQRRGPEFDSQHRRRKKTKYRGVAGAVTCLLLLWKKIQLFCLAFHL